LSPEDAPFLAPRIFLKRRESKKKRKKSKRQERGKKANKKKLGSIFLFCLKSRKKSAILEFQTYFNFFFLMYKITKSLQDWSEVPTYR